MARIDRQTVERILEAADIVDIVSDFVSLKRRGANYIGLCPFHNERTPSFSVSRTKGICKCFSCGKGGSPINFLMELEQFSYNEALRYIARKYNIEIKEHELTEEERQAENDRESMLAINEFALKHFMHNLKDTDAGNDIALPYLRQRGISQAMIDKFKLGYSIDKRDDLSRTAISKGFSERFLTDTGLCYRGDHDTLIDRFRSRIIYPVLSVSGKVIAFGGRTMRTSKEVAKYVNSPESVIYSKSRELYGLFQAKHAIAKADRCILVEGYMDVISMHQSGVENVVASSGTSLTEGQIRLIHRFTDNITVIYDSDPAGIKASLRGIDLILAEGMNVKVVLFPEGEDPDSYARTHSSSELQKYLEEKEVDFIQFKTDILLKGTDSDPILKSKAIQSIVRTISVIPDQITRNVYVTECSRRLSISEQILALQVKKYRADFLEKETARKQRKEGYEQIEEIADTTLSSSEINAEAAHNGADDSAQYPADYLRPFELELMRYIVKYGLANLCTGADAEGIYDDQLTIISYISRELADDEISISNKDLSMLYSAALAVSQGDNIASRIEAERHRLKEIIDEKLNADLALLRDQATDIEAAERSEKLLHEDAEMQLYNGIDEFRASFIGHALMSDSDDTIRSLSTDLITTRYQLSKIHTKYAQLPTERERLADLVPLAVYNLKNAIVELNIHQLKEKLNGVWKSDDHTPVDQIISDMQKLSQIKCELGRYLGERILTRPQSR